MTQDLRITKTRLAKDNLKYCSGFGSSSTIQEVLPGIPLVYFDSGRATGRAVGQGFNPDFANLRFGYREAV